ncbi:MAG: DedA family protein [Methanomassiliicoccales archaeon]|jgi:membrane protein DedA with SNARE-associated domain
MSIISELSNWIIEFIDASGYLGLFAAMFFEGIITPIPSEMVVPFAGYLAQTGRLNFVLVILAATAGSTAGSTVSYALARYLGRPFFLRYGKWIFVDEETLDKADGFFARRGKYAVLLGHMVLGVRSIISYPAGLTKMDVKMFILFTFIGGLVWNTVLTTAGYMLGSKWMDFWQATDGWDTVIVVAVVVAVVAYLLWNWNRKRKSKA